MNKHAITVFICQQFSDGGRREIDVVTKNTDDHDEPQGMIGEAVGNALRQILAAQNTGDNSEFWSALFREMAHTADGGEWVRRLMQAIHEWRKATRTRNVTLDEFMRQIVMDYKPKAAL